MEFSLFFISGAIPEAKWLHISQGAEPPIILDHASLRQQHLEVWVWFKRLYHYNIN